MMRKFLLALCFSFLLLSIWPTIVSQRSVADAHAFVIGSDPVDGSTVTTAPQVVRIFFDLSISPASIAHVYTPDERIVDAARSSISSTNPRELDTPLVSPEQLPPGSYTVRWTALAQADGHTTHGVIGFNIGQSSAGLPGQTILGPSTSNIPPELNPIGILAVAWEWLVLMALTCWIGILFSEGPILAGVERTSSLLTHTRKRARPLQWLCLAALLVGEIITLVLRASQLSQAQDGGGINLVALAQILTQTNYGFLWLVRLALLVLALGFLWWTDRQQGNAGRKSHSRLNDANADNVPKSPALERTHTIAWLLLAGLIVLTLALSGDAAALDSPHASAIVLDWLYLAARSIWLGGLAYLAYVLLPLLPMVEPDRSLEVYTALLRRFYPLMLAVVGVLLVAGFYLTEASLSNIQQLLSDPYGRTLLLECVLVAMMILLGGYAIFMLRPKLTRQAALLPVVDVELPARRARQSALDATARRLKQTLNVLTWLAMGTLLCAALMAFYAPPIVFPAIDYTQSTNALSPSPTATTFFTQTQSVGNLSITLQVLPGQVDYTNTVIVVMNDRSSGNPVTDAQVQMTINMELMNMGTARASIKGGNPTYVATFERDTVFSMFGVWDIRLTIQRPASAPVQAVFSVTLRG